MMAPHLGDETLQHAADLVRRWESTWGPFQSHPSIDVDPARMRRLLTDYASRLGDNYPFFHPRYAGQMLKPPHPVAVAAYLAAMLINPNNHAIEGGPATAAMEKEAVRALANMFGFSEASLGHLTTSGTVANLEALWVARETHPAKKLLVSEQAHYTHTRMAGVLRMPVEVVATDSAGRMVPEAVERALQSGDVGTVVATAGTTGLGAVDPVADLAQLAARYGARLHVDAAYGGFYRLLAIDGDELTPETRRHLVAIDEADSVVVDPHKHGLQPYGCGCVIFRDAAVGRFYRHESPYTYFTSDALHLGEISLECSRAGAAAGALWLTLQAIPLDRSGMGAILAACRRAARGFHARIAATDVLQALQIPELDVVTYFPIADGSPAGIDVASQTLFERAMKDAEDPYFLSVLRVRANRIVPEAGEEETVRVLRSVLMKPEHESWVDLLSARLEQIAGQEAQQHG